MAILAVKTPPEGAHPNTGPLTTTSLPVGMLLPLPSAIVKSSVAGVVAVAAITDPLMTALPVAKTMVLCMRTSAVPHTPSPAVGLGVAALAQALGEGARGTENSPVSKARLS